MHCSFRQGCVWTGLAALTAGLALQTAAQVAPSSPPPPANAARDDAVVLSPFTVSTDRDTGFVAASSLAGGRLAGELRDTPVAYSVITREFIEALGITNQFDASDWAPNSVKSIAAILGTKWHKLRPAV